MNKQRKVLITITYNEMGIIIDTKAEEVAQPNLQPTCNQLATDTISRQAAIEVIDAVFPVDPMKSEYAQGIACGAALSKTYIEQLPSAQPERKISNKEWIDFLVFQFDISRTSAKEMLHGMMQWKKEDNFKKQFRR